jgi:hypothetical protein
MSYFVISCQGEKGEINISGIEAALGIDKKDLNVSWADDNLELKAYPILLIIPIAALIVLFALTIPAVRKKNEDTKLPGKKKFIMGIIAIIGGITGLIILAIANNIAIAEVKEQGKGSLSCSPGIGFTISKFAFVVMLIMPIVDIFVIPYVHKMLSKKSIEE